MPYYDEMLPEEVAVKDAVLYWQERAKKAEAENAALLEELEAESYVEQLAKSGVTFWDSTKDQKLFYWTIPAGYPPEQCADEGWYQYTPRGLIYLGREIEDIDDLRAQLAARERDLIALPQILLDLAKAKKRVEELEAALKDTLYLVLEHGSPTMKAHATRLGRSMRVLEGARFDGEGVA